MTHHGREPHLLPAVPIGWAATQRAHPNPTLAGIKSQQFPPLLPTGGPTAPAGGLF